MTEVKVMGPAGQIRPDWLWPDADEETRWTSPEWFDEDGKFRAPPAFIELFVPGDGDPLLTVGYDGATSAPLARSAEDRQARTIRWVIPRIVLSEAVYEMLGTLAPVAGRIADGLSVGATPRGRFQRLTPAAEEAREEFRRRLDAGLAVLPVLDLHHIEDAGLAVLESAVTAETRDEDLPAVAEDLRARITPDRPGNLVVLDRAVEHLARRRDTARAGVRDRLAITARLASGDRRERDALLRRITAWDDGADTYRSLGQLVGMSHTQVRTIVRLATAGRDEALDDLAATMRSLLLAWDPPALPHASDRDPGDQDGLSDWELEQDELAADEDRRAHLRRKSCAVCGKPSRRLVRRWQVGRTAIAADDDDPARDQAGYVEGLSEPPSYTLQPSWAVCGTACARKVIEEDKAQPSGGSHVTGRTEFYYEVEPWRYLPHDSELPRALVRLRGSTDQIGYLREQLERAVTGADAAAAALDLGDLRRRVAHAAAILAGIRTYTPAPRTFGPGDRQPDDVRQVRHGDTLYSKWPALSLDGQRDRWEGPGGGRHTWDELTELAAGSLIEIPREKVILPGGGDDEDW
jgi:hypothetical protein